LVHSADGKLTQMVDRSLCMAKVTSSVPKTTTMAYYYYFVN